ncbi:MAG: hypothetical protein JST11_16025 [Acidobacteria bacterium]|nr:hypothetical protein [Acidobacteriota bacterium]
MRGGPLDAIMRLFHKRPFRCRRCRARFYSREMEPVLEPEENVEAED